MITLAVPEIRNILNNVPGNKVHQVQFFTNAINTRTKGIDIVATGNWKNQKSDLGILLAANFTNTRLFGKIKTTDKLQGDSLLFKAEEKTIVEKGQPDSKIILNLNYKTGRFTINIRNTRFERQLQLLFSKSPV